MTSPMALSRFKVLDLTRVRAGPTAVRCLSDWGAQVIKIEMPDEAGDMLGSRDGSDFQNLHRNKRAITLNLKEADGRAIFYELVKNADVVVENYRPDVKHRLEIDYETLKKINPRIVYGSVSGFGQDGPYGKRPGFDQIAQGMGGLMWITGLPEQGPVRAGIPIADLGAGIFCAMGIMVALLEREVSGEGQWVKSSLLQAQVALLDFQATRWLIDGKVPPQAGNDHPTSIPTGVFETKDGFINIAAAGAIMFKRVSEAIGAPELNNNPDYASDELRSKNRKALNAAIAEKTKHKTSQEWIDLLNAAGVPSGPIYKMDEMFDDPQVKHLGMAVEVEHPRLGKQRLVNQGMQLSRTPSRIRSATPERGEHTDEILGEIGYDAEKIADLRQRGIV
jgi:crotonobetainyl-CoA:carnitine CoA-transferase CaiB-like acyl-CoA transferase